MVKYFSASLLHFKKLLSLYANFSIIKSIYFYLKPDIIFRSVNKIILILNHL